MKNTRERQPDQINVAANWGAPRRVGKRIFLSGHRRHFRKHFVPRAPLMYAGSLARGKGVTPR